MTDDPNTVWTRFVENYPEPEGTKHPAPFSREVIMEIARIIDEHGTDVRVLDPFAGIGRIPCARRTHRAAC